MCKPLREMRVKSSQVWEAETANVVAFVFYKLGLGSSQLRSSQIVVHGRYWTIPVVFPPREEPRTFNRCK